MTSKLNVNNWVPIIITIIQGLNFKIVHTSRKTVVTKIVLMLLKTYNFKCLFHVFNIICT